MLRNVSLTPTFSISDFRTNPPDADQWAGTRWIIAHNPEFINPVLDLVVTDHPSILLVENGILLADKEYYLKAGHIGKTFGAGPLTDTLKFITRKNGFLEGKVVAEIELETVFNNMEMHRDELGVS